MYRIKKPKWRKTIMPTYTLELKLNTKKYSDQRYLENYFREVAKIGNTDHITET